MEGPNLFNSIGRVEAGSGSPLGTAFLVDHHGTMVTDAHVALSDRELKVRLADGKLYQSRIIDMNDSADLAVLKLEGYKESPLQNEQLPPLELSDNSNLKTGASVKIAGFPVPKAEYTEASGKFIANVQAADIYKSKFLDKEIDASRLYSGLSESELVRAL